MAGCGNSIVLFEFPVELHIGTPTSPVASIMSKKEHAPEKVEVSICLFSSQEKGETRECGQGHQ